MMKRLEQLLKALQALGNSRGRGWILIFAITGWFMYMSISRPETTAGMALSIAQASSAPVYAMAILVVGVVWALFGYVREALGDCRVQHELCLAEQSAMREALVQFVMNLRGASKKKGERIIDELDRAVDEARARFVPRLEPQYRVEGGRRRSDFRKD